MSEEKLWNNARRWFNQATSDLEAADVLLTGEKYAQAAFWSQQAAEKAMKAVWIVLDRDPWGHSVARLIRDLTSEEAGLLSQHEKAALSLDKLYIPTRYPDALVELTPSEAYTEEEARKARESASELIDAVGVWLDERSET